MCLVMNEGGSRVRTEVQCLHLIGVMGRRPDQGSLFPLRGDWFGAERFPPYSSGSATWSRPRDEARELISLENQVSTMTDAQGIV